MLIDAVTLLYFMFVTNVHEVRYGAWYQYRRIVNLNTTRDLAPIFESVQPRGGTSSRV